MNKKIPVWLLLLLLWISLMITLTFGWAVYHIKSKKGVTITKTDSAILAAASFPALVHESINQLRHPPLARPDAFPGLSGLKVERNYVDSNYLLLSAYDAKAKQSQAKLIRLSDQKIIYTWSPDMEKVKKIYTSFDKEWDKTDKHSFLMTHPLISADGSLVFHSALSPLIKIDKDSKIVWAVKEVFSHSLEFDADGNIWAEVIVKPSNTGVPGLSDYEDNYIEKISPDGKTLFKKSVTELLVENEYRGLVYGTEVYEGDVLHLNDIQPALTSSGYWQTGDLLISLRHKSAVFLYRPSTNKVTWLKIGPWLHQHDADFVDSTTIGIFGNDIIRNRPNNIFIEGHSEEYTYDFKTNKTETPYTEFLKKAGVRASFEGRSDILSNGDLFVEETNNNRLLRGNKTDVIWQYAERIDKHSLAAVSWSRFVTRDEFKALTFLKK
jgi:hypothetical protein